MKGSLLCSLYDPNKSTVPPPPWTEQTMAGQDVWRPFRLRTYYSFPLGDPLGFVFVRLTTQRTFDRQS